MSPFTYIVLDYLALRIARCFMCSISRSDSELVCAGSKIERKFPSSDSTVTEAELFV